MLSPETRAEGGKGAGKHGTKGEQSKWAKTIMWMKRKDPLVKRKSQIFETLFSSR